MDSIILAFSFAAAIVISGCVVMVFSRSIDDILAHLIPEGMAHAWCKYVKFALFTVSFAGGMRLTDIATFITQKQLPGQSPIDGGESLLEVFRTITGSLVTAAAALLVFFVSTLVVYAAFHVYQSHSRTVERPRGTERLPGAGDRHSGGHPIRS